MALRTPFTEPAGNLVARIMAQAEGLLRGAPRQLDH
jgi:hypothetical protein